ncbi:MAG: anti-sigma factor [Marinobacter sp.]|uniref:anti-sigma factor n=1 Tax=Marinobacter sp. TaxID=50741 RepID=UPI003C58CE92
MKKTPERIESLAAEYVLGSLKGRARSRFERWMMESGRVRQEVWYWEEKLGQLSDQVPAREPPTSVWQGIERRLWPQKPAAQTPGGRGLWSAWSLMATAAALILAVMLVQQPGPQPLPEPGSRLSGAIVQADASDPLWLVSESGADRHLRMRSVAASSAQAGKDYELWVVPAEGNPLSLGVVLVGDVLQVELTDEARTMLNESRTLAISLEPEGGSPTGAPTGPVLHVTKLYEL